MQSARAAKGGAAAQAGPTVTLDEPFRLDRFLPYRLSVVTNRISRAFAQRYSREFGISIPEWRVLAVLGTYAPLSSNEVCERTAMDKAKVSRAVSLLRGKGLLVRAPDPRDQRLLRLSFTPKGRTLYEGVVPLACALERQLTEALDAGERETLERILGKLERSLECKSGCGG